MTLRAAHQWRIKAFGHLGHTGASTMVLKDVYYLQSNQNVQPDQSNKDQQPPQLSLVKLGGEIHGPQDEMFLNRDQVLFWENLTDSGKVVQAINQAVKK